MASLKKELSEKLDNAAQKADRTLPPYTQSGGDEMVQRLDEMLRQGIEIQPTNGISLLGAGTVKLMINCFLIGFDLGRLELGDAYDRTLNTHFTDAYSNEALAFHLLVHTLAKSLKQFLQAIEGEKTKDAIIHLENFMKAPTSTDYLDQVTLNTLLTEEFFRDPGASSLCRLVCAWLEQWQTVHFPYESRISPYYPYFFTRAFYEQFNGGDNKNYKRLTSQLCVEENVLQKAAKVCNEWKTYHDQLKMKTEEQLPWFRDIDLKVKDFFFEDQQLRWQLSPGHRIENGEHKPLISYRAENALRTLESVVENRTPLAQVSAPFGYGCTILAKMLCKTLAEKGDRVLYVSLKDITHDIDIHTLLIRKFATGTHKPFSTEFLEYQGPAVLVFDYLNETDKSKCSCFFRELKSYITDTEENGGKISVLLFLPEHALEVADSTLGVPKDLHFELQGLDTPELRKAWLRAYAKAAGKNTQILTTLLQSNPEIDRQMEHPAVCSLIARLYSSAENINDLPRLQPGSRLIDLLPELQKKLHVDTGFESTLVQFQKLLRELAHHIWQNDGISQDDFERIAKANMQENDLNALESLYIFRRAKQKTFFSFGFLHDACCASYIINIFLGNDGNFSPKNWFENFSRRPPSQALLTRLKEYCAGKEEDECKQWQRKLAELLTERLEHGWQFNENPQTTAQAGTYASNADLCLLVVLSALGSKTQTCAEVQWSGDNQGATPQVNRWLHGLFGGTGQRQWPPQGLRYFNWLRFPEGTILDTCFCCRENFEGMEPKHFKWEYSADAERYIRASNAAILHTIKQMRFQRSIYDTVTPSSEKDASFALFYLKKLMFNRANRLPVLLETFDPDKFHREKRKLKPFLEELITLYREPKPILNCSDELSMEIDWDVLDKLLQRLLNNAERYGINGLPIRADVKIQGDSVTICITNYAVSVDANEQKQLCDYHFRGDNAKRLYGNGEGLWYCRQAAKALNGDFDIVCQTYNELPYDLAALAIYSFNEEAKLWTQNRYEEQNGQTLDWQKVQQTFEQLPNNNFMGAEDFDFLEKEYGKQQKSPDRVHFQEYKYSPIYAVQRFALPATAKYVATLMLKIGKPEGEPA